MKYWGYFASKIIAVVAILAGLWPLVRLILPHPHFIYGDMKPMGHDVGYTLGVYSFWLLGAGLAYLAVWDQRYRCRTCCRRLRMPVTRGTWSRAFLFDKPHTEYICPFGHGTLKVPDLQISGKEPTDWAEHQDMWRELELLETGKR